LKDGSHIGDRSASLRNIRCPEIPKTSKSGSASLRMLIPKDHSSLRVIRLSLSSTFGRAGDRCAAASGLSEVSPHLHARRGLPSKEESGCAVGKLWRDGENGMARNAGDNGALEEEAHRRV